MEHHSEVLSGAILRYVIALMIFATVSVMQKESICNINSYNYRIAAVTGDQKAVTHLYFF